jgi:SAM-dependent methyltransferase
MQQINLFDHPLKRLLASSAAEATAKALEHGFNRTYFDDPDAITGFRGYQEYGNGAEGHRDFSREAESVVAALRERAAPRDSGVREVLDIGCAKGFLVRRLRGLGVHAWGCDISAYAVAAAPVEVRRYLWVSTIQDIDLHECYELVHIHGVLIYLTLDEIEASLAAIHGICTLGLMLYEPTREMLQTWLDAGDEGAFDPLRKQELPESVWAELLEKQGFRRHPRGWWKK